MIPGNRILEFKRNDSIQKKMAWNEAKMLCNTYNTDALISLHNFKTRVFTTFKDQDYYNGVDESYFSMREAKTQIIYEALFWIYDPYKK